ncbi:glutamine--fructose-6-phosphate transaminase (isomerizing) [Commensalibacter papalotli (ex Botero et al. 2024)]|uniref:Glutamine--fructose-6-phosphate aminotransferase [isomerizing] n=1 Tax=Commensalibacter papalotli (ex Botero et al. 2024) TaxID=2972766 RepID=A0ABN8W4N4_9PROT|nr:glutamine--fructose-6-phosphate transaminase (isomerizing) [Commensalibacter papalotli (ex Botero et al. 2024)]CAI3923049.1 Glucosamine 6-phosphate synthetase [Commensalibacter papalotli (ex Botero et al. 2024)]CAI3929105.1 Glucosamine 6-phosphate synthetase [Commensalibacter papalotli (ex Botero et al. 2024)]
MCGIVGILGKQPAVPTIIEALRRLEYRGYDSAGVATIENGHIGRRRASGKLDNLVKRVDGEPLSGLTGIGHTRWATHGAPTENNAHPHATENVAVVHNGIIENHEELKQELIELGQVFNSETDSETIVQMVDYHLKQGKTPKEAAYATLQRLEGAYAIAMIFASDENIMIGARHGAPLVVGFGEDEMYLGSDSLAVAPMTRKIAYMPDGVWTVLSHKGAEFFDMDGSTVECPVQTTALMAGAIGKDGYRHYMEKELHEHPVVIGQTLRRFVNPVTHKIELPELPFDIKNLKRGIITACGSAFYAGVIGRYWLEEIARLPIDLDVASEMRYRNPPFDQGGMGLLVSQSGETADTLAALRALKQAGQKIISVLNNEHSSMARESDVVLGMDAGVEIAVASTKAFTAQLTVLACLTLVMGQERGTISSEYADECLTALLDLPSRVAEILQMQEQIQKMAHIISQVQSVIYLGRGIMFPVAMEGALKLKEISYIHADAYAAGEMKHGPIALIDNTVPVISLLPSGPLFEKTLSNLQEAKARGGRILIFTDAKGAERVKNIAEQIVVLPTVHSFVTPPLYTVPVQMLAYEAALLKGTDVDQPRNLAKSVTVE